ncbi:cyclic lactone autoinducer peptide [Alkalihalobacillus oceani]|uniref:Cyclic lactone autoinducer peptide n=1 Tax=Halalkalibacter oceani TaxID=1653776 RepID=A0A9X2DU59_9BACI|nr:cyclic lactone autoinducer peptide [Halalkalibacter oceani]MCM3716160.1 cyclic lactone autoinducer peptide [Halalkalibacter oceani]MCM3761798.1 cyclic lactone autoinducer peptide [Halalkalibacter oceani]
MKKELAKYISKATTVCSSAFVQASSPFSHAPKIPESLKKQK